MSSTPQLREPVTAALEKGRESFHNNSWSAAFSQLSAADREMPLEPDDLQYLAVAANLIGREDAGKDALARAHQAFLAAGNNRGAARCAFWLGFSLLNNGELAQAGGWLARASRLLADGHETCVEQGYLLIPAGIRSVIEGNLAVAYDAFTRAATIGEQFGDTDLITMARMGQGRVLIRRGETVSGVSLLDESMVAVTAGEVSPMVAGGVYCSVLDACGEIFDLRRAHEWTSALERWCASQPDIVPFRGHCLVRRAELLQLRGSWPDALEELRQACERLSYPTLKPQIGAAFHRIGDLYRLRGQFAESEEAYAKASQWARSPTPGLALLRLAQGKPDAASVAIRNVASAVKEPGARAAVLDAYVGIMLAANDVPAARIAADELAEIAARFDAQLLNALAMRANGAVLLAEGDANAALGLLRQAFAAWRDIDAPYEAARVRVLVALACRQMGDSASADMELDAARTVFQRLAAAPDLTRVEALLRKPSATPDGPLTSREIRVLKLVASGSTNREIATTLGISEKTVARHLSNIFNKLDLSSRTAAAAWAYQHGLVSSST